MIATLLLAVSACRLAWDPVGVLPPAVRGQLQSGPRVVVCRTAELPAAVVKAVGQPVGDGAGLADPGQEWNSSCKLRLGFPRRQLVAAVESGPHWVVHYRQGGIAAFEFVVVLTKEGEGLRVVWQGECDMDDGHRTKCRVK